MRIKIVHFVSHSAPLSAVNTYTLKNISLLIHHQCAYIRTKRIEKQCGALTPSRFSCFTPGPRHSLVEGVKLI
jgi:hypothetical protein